MAEVLSGCYVVDVFKPEIIEMVLGKLTPEQVRVAVVGKKFEGTTDLVEKWYGTQYSISPIPEDTINVSAPAVYLDARFMSLEIFINDLPF